MGDLHTSFAGGRRSRHREDDMPPFLHDDIIVECQAEMLHASPVMSATRERKPLAAIDLRKIIGSKNIKMSRQPRSAHAVIASSPPFRQWRMREIGKIAPRDEQNIFTIC